MANDEWTPEGEAAFRERARSARAVDLWHVAKRTLDTMATENSGYTMPGRGEKPWPAYYASTLGYRATLAGVFALLALNGTADVADGLRLKILNDWGRGDAEGQQVTIIEHLEEMFEYNPLARELPDLGAGEWAALAALLTNRTDEERMQLLMDATGCTAAEVNTLIEALDDASATRKVVLTH